MYNGHDKIFMRLDDDYNISYNICIRNKLKYIFIFKNQTRDSDGYLYYKKNTV